MTRSASCSFASTIPSINGTRRLGSPSVCGRSFRKSNVVHLPDYKRVDEEIVDAEIAVAWSIRPEQIAAAKKLRWIHSPAAAVHQLMFPELVNSDIILTNAREVHGPVVAEHVIALIFALAKKIPGSVRLQEKHVWGQQILWDELPRVREVAGATLGMVGLGSIGRAVVKSAKALGMRVIAVREHPEKGSEGADAVFGPAQIDEVFRQADYIVLAAPVTASTKAIANAERLALMKPDACLINVGRGPLVDEPALAAALREKKIGGAALDVFPKEPLARRFAAVGRPESADHSAHRRADRQVMGAALRAVLRESAALSERPAAAGGGGQAKRILILSTMERRALSPGHRSTADAPGRTHSA